MLLTAAAALRNGFVALVTAFTDISTAIHTQTCQSSRPKKLILA
jgi:hypothetical protein